MAFAPSGRRGPPSFNRPSSEGARRPPAPRPDNDRRRMLDVRREGHFKYDLRELLVGSSLPAEQLASFAATVFSKGSRLSTADAKDFVTEKMNAGILAKPDRDAINTLIDRYSRWR